MQGALVTELPRTGQAGGSPETRAGGSEPLLAGRLGGMTSSLPVSATEALLFQPLGRHDAMLSLKVKGRAAFARGAHGPSREGLRGKTLTPSPGCLRKLGGNNWSASPGARPGSPPWPGSHSFRESWRQTGCSARS